MDFSKHGIPSEEWASFVAANPSTARDGFANNTPAHAEELRRISNQARRLNSRNKLSQTGLDKSVEITTVLARSTDLYTVPIRRYEPHQRKRMTQRNALIYIHGGGYLLGDEESDDFVCANTAATLDIVVLSVIYRHTHKYQHPAQVDDVWVAFKYIQSNYESLGISISDGITLMGISAGAGLAASIALREIEENERASKNAKGTLSVNGILLAMPWLIHIDNYPLHLFTSASISSKIQCTGAPIVPQERMRLFTDLLAANSPSDPLLNIALAPNDILKLWPKTAIIAAGMDPLRDDGLIFAKRLESSG